MFLLLFITWRTWLFWKIMLHVGVRNELNILNKLMEFHFRNYQVLWRSNIHGMPQSYSSPEIAQGMTSDPLSVGTVLRHVWIPVTATVRKSEPTDVIHFPLTLMIYFLYPLRYKSRQKATSWSKIILKMTAQGWN